VMIVKRGLVFYHLAPLIHHKLCNNRIPTMIFSVYGILPPIKRTLKVV
jgi:hypothetical protein